MRWKSPPTWTRSTGCASTSDADGSDLLPRIRAGDALEPRGPHGSFQQFDTLPTRAARPRGVADRSVRLLSIEPETCGTESVAFDDERERRRKVQCPVWSVHSSPSINAVASRPRTALATFVRGKARPNGRPGASETSRTFQGTRLHARLKGRAPSVAPTPPDDQFSIRQCAPNDSETQAARVVALTQPTTPRSWRRSPVRVGGRRLGIDGRGLGRTVRRR